MASVGAISMPKAIKPEAGTMTANRGIGRGHAQVDSRHDGACYPASRKRSRTWQGSS